MTLPPAALRLDHASRRFGNGGAVVTAVDDVSLEVAAGELVLVMGPSGSGKTTLLAMCGALLRPTSGRIWVGDSEVSALGERALPELRLRHIGFIFQSANLLTNLTAAENVRIVLDAAGMPRRAANERARELLDSLRLSGRADSRPDELSGGERQRVAIARALANDPPLLLADEPTANLDSRTGYQLMHTLELLAKERGKTVVIATHDNRIADVADRVTWLEDGQLSEQPPDGRDAVLDPVCRMRIDASRPPACGGMGAKSSTSAPTSASSASTRNRSGTRATTAGMVPPSRPGDSGDHGSTVVRSLRPIEEAEPPCAGDGDCEAEEQVALAVPAREGANALDVLQVVHGDDQDAEAHEHAPHHLVPGRTKPKRGPTRHGDP